MSTIKSFPRVLSLEVTGRLTCPCNPQSYSSGSFVLLVGSTKPGRVWRRANNHAAKKNALLLKPHKWDYVHHVIWEAWGNMCFDKVYISGGLTWSPGSPWSPGVPAFPWNSQESHQKTISARHTVVWLILWNLHILTKYTDISHIWRVH